MKLAGKTVLLCTCEATIPLDADRLAAALGTETGRVFTQLCRSELPEYRRALAGGPLMVACGQEVALFRELAHEVEHDAPLCVDIRDRAGWSSQAGKSIPKMAALLEEALIPHQEPEAVMLSSAGRVLVLGAGAEALDAAAKLAVDRVVQLLLPPGADGLPPPSHRTFAIRQGKVVRAEGCLGNWTFTVTGLAESKPSSRRQLDFFPPHIQDSQIRADVVLDLLPGPPLVAARDGWISADPRSPLALERAVEQVRGLVGEFEKPRYITVNADACAHARTGQVGCTRCLDVCPSSALSAVGDAVQVDAHACSGHGACVSVCPTGAISFHVPSADQFGRSVWTLLSTYRDAGGVQPVLLLHREGTEVLSHVATQGDGLPSQVIPFAVGSVTALGPDHLLAMIASGAAEVLVLAEPGDVENGVVPSAALAFVNRVTAGLGLEERVRVIRIDDPAIVAWGPHPSALAPWAEMAHGDKRVVMDTALVHLLSLSPMPDQVVALVDGDPMGTVLVDQDKCTLCMACAVACPPKALKGNLQDLTLSFTEQACTQCGLCRTICPEKAVRLVARFAPAQAEPEVLKQDVAQECISCGKPYAPKASVDRMVERLKGHSMFAEPGKLDLLRMCEDCRSRQ